MLQKLAGSSEELEAIATASRILDILKDIAQKHTWLLRIGIGEHCVSSHAKQNFSSFSPNSPVILRREQACCVPSCKILAILTFAWSKFRRLNIRATGPRMPSSQN